ncbi:MAG: activase [Fibrobacteres bacterium]|nr:activase [Fibrobacterota bacterium]
MRSCGINIGSSSVKVVVVEDGKIVFSQSKSHDGDVKSSLFQLLKNGNVSVGTKSIVTANDGLKQFRLKGTIEAIAMQEAILASGERYDAVVAMGGEDLVVYALDSNGRIVNSFSGNKCASGTGEFFKQQLKRMDLDLDEGIKAGYGSKVQKISSRCSVFMKSDCTHKLNKGESTKGDIVLSLSNVMAEKAVDFLKKAKLTSGRVLLTGGLTRNPHLVKFISEAMPDLQFVTPETAPVYEAYGAALLAAKEGEGLPELEKIYTDEHTSYEKMKSLPDYRDQVSYMKPKHGLIQKGRDYILGIDGGSTTTKVTLIDYESEEIVASFYGRTHGDPVNALKQCLVEVKKEVIDEIGDMGINIKLVATTGSSREILGVFMETTGVYNEIIAHTVGTTYFDPEIDTIFEIGGQDAKYVYLKNNVPIDYAMNEACSAGTGSFLEESAKGDLNIESASEIGDIAEQAMAPLKFGEHCSAFINSDIRKAIQEGSGKYNIVAGLVYSIVLNYLNRVVGNRPIGNKIVLQGGVAKNSAIPLAFAAMLGKPIIVPPNPELMGCFGVGILAKRKFESGLLSECKVDIDQTIDRVIANDGEIVCKSCSNLCPVKKLKVNNTVYFFGGRCNKWANTRKKLKVDEEKTKDLTELRTTLLFDTWGADFSKTVLRKEITVAVPQAFSIYSLWPLYSHFFNELGVKTILSTVVDKEGLEKINAPFCYPGEIAHGMTGEMVKLNPDFYFLPHFKDAESEEKDVHGCLCPIMQGLPYYLRTSFQLKDEQILAPLVSFDKGPDVTRREFADVAVRLGFTAEDGERAFNKGLDAWRGFINQCRAEGAKAMAEAESTGKTAIVLFGRPYNAFTHYANMGIPRKFTSRGFTVIPFDMIPYGKEEIYENMYWHFGQQNMRAAVHIAKKKNLYMCYISNFSCAPDSFILHYMRWIHGTKPFLTLELDSHTADAGIDTRIEAFLDIIDGYAKSGFFQTGSEFDMRFEAVSAESRVKLIDKVEKREIDFKDKRIKLLLPNMGSETTDAITVMAKRYGIDTAMLPVSDRETVQLARGVASGKECIPCLLVLGSFMQYFLKYGNDPNRIYILFMPITTGPCRTGQYAVFYDRILRESGYSNIAVLKLNSDNSYNEMGPGFSKMAWHAICAGDALKDLKSGIRVCLKDPSEGFRVVDKHWQKMLKVFESGNLSKDLPAAIEEMSAELATLPRIRTAEEVKKVLIVGEIFVRRDDYSVSPLIDKLTDWGILTRISGLSEWIHYLDYVREYRLRNAFKGKSFFHKAFSNYFVKLSLMKVEFLWKHHVQEKIEAAFRKSGLLPAAPSDMQNIMERAPEFTSKDFETEATLSPAVAATAMEAGYSGIVIISPFACLPGRLIEAIYAPWARDRNFPVIALENDGNVYPPNIISKINIFCLNVSEFKSKK